MTQKLKESLLASSALSAHGISLEQIKSDRAREILHSLGIRDVYYFADYGNYGRANLLGLDGFPWELVELDDDKESLIKMLTTSSENWYGTFIGCGVHFDAKITGKDGYELTLGVRGLYMHEIEPFRQRLPHDVMKKLDDAESSKKLYWRGGRI